MSGVVLAGFMGLAFLLGIWIGYLICKYITHKYQVSTVDGYGNVVIQSGASATGDIVGLTKESKSKSKCEYCGAG